MPKTTEHPKLRTHTKTGSDGRVWVSYFYDMRGTGEKDVSLGTDRDAALSLWARLREAAASGACRPKQHPPDSRAASVAATRRSAAQQAQKLRTCGLEFGATLGEAHVHRVRETLARGRSAYLPDSE